VPTQGVMQVEASCALLYQLVKLFPTHCRPRKMIRSRHDPRYRLHRHSQMSSSVLLESMHHISVSLSSSSCITPRTTCNIGVIPLPAHNMTSFPGLCSTPRQLARPLPFHTNEPMGPLNSMDSPISSSWKPLFRGVVSMRGCHEI
jgi:hypothetical protein